MDGGLDALAKEGEDVAQDDGRYVEDETDLFGE